MSLSNEIILEKGDNFHIYRGLRHQMLALEDTELFEFSTQHFDSDSIRVIPGD
jgi:quercetin dioxygenase-like cupin family protein